MINYKITRLNAKTPNADRDKLLAALHAVSGVDKAVLHPDKSEVEVHGKPKNEPKRSDVMEACKKAGFVVSN